MLEFLKRHYKGAVYMGYRIAICDDDSKMADILLTILKDEFSQAGRQDLVADYYGDGESLLMSLKDKAYKAILLDINMEPLDGFAVAEKIGRLDYKTKIVFVTSYDDIVYDTFDYTPFYFIRKSRCERYTKRLVSKLLEIDGFEKNIELDISEKIININSTNIKYVESQDHYLTVYCDDDSNYVIRKNMSEFEQDIVGTDLVRAHKKYIINYRYIAQIKQSTNEIIMKDGNILKLGRTYKEKYMKGYIQYKHSRQAYD